MPDDFKAEVEAKANLLIREFLEPTFVKPPPRDRRWNRSFFYLVGHYALSPTFESRFARLEHAGDGRFHLAYFRHTGK